MGDLIIVTLLAGGMLEIIRTNGGIDFIVSGMTKRINGRRGAELSIAGLVSLANLCTANNTIAIITTGRIARDITERFGLDPRKTASILDTFSCLVQGLIPYGAQLLMAAGLSGASSISIIGYLYYPFIMGLFALLAILLRFPRKYS
jgi:Na+/H+ antiporter NhaC